MKRFEEIAADLEKKIQSSVLKGRMPGIMRLSNDYNAGQATIRQSLRLLINKGLLTVDGTRGTFISNYDISKGRTGVIALVSRFGEQEGKLLFEDLNMKLSSEGYHLLQLSNLEPLLKERPEILGEMPCDGFLLYGMNRELLAVLRQYGKKVVSLNACSVLEGVSWVDYDWESAIRSVLQNFIDKGHTRIGFVMWNNNRFHFQDRMLNLFREVCGKNFDPELFFAQLVPEELFRCSHENYMKTAGHIAAAYYSRMESPPTALYIHWGETSAECIQEDFSFSGISPEIEIVCTEQSYLNESSGFPFLKMEPGDLIWRGALLLLQEIRGAQSGMTDRSPVYLCRDSSIQNKKGKSGAI